MSNTKMARCYGGPLDGRRIEFVPAAYGDGAVFHPVGNGRYILKVTNVGPVFAWIGEDDE
jgi:hypothetical protein